MALILGDNRKAKSGTLEYLYTKLQGAHTCIKEATFAPSTLFGGLSFRPFLCLILFFLFYTSCLRGKLEVSCERERDVLVYWAPHVSVWQWWPGVNDNPFETKRNMPSVLDIGRTNERMTRVSIIVAKILFFSVYAHATWPCVQPLLAGSS